MTAATVSLTCPYCRAELADESAAQACVRCQTPVHRDCAEIHRRCVVYGCRGRRFRPVKALRNTPRSLTYRPPLALSDRLALAVNEALDDASVLAIGLLGVTVLVIESLFLG